MLIALLLAAAVGVCAEHDPQLTAAEIVSARWRLEHAGFATTTKACVDERRDARLVAALAFGTRGRSGLRRDGDFTVVVVDEAARTRAVELLREAVTLSSTPTTTQQAQLLLFAQLAELDRVDEALTTVQAAYDAAPTGPLSLTALGARVWWRALQSPVLGSVALCAAPWTAGDRALIDDARLLLARLEAGPQDVHAHKNHLTGPRELEQRAVRNLIAVVQASHGDVVGMKTLRREAEAGRRGSWPSFIMCLPEHERVAAARAAHAARTWIPHQLERQLGMLRERDLVTTTTTACGTDVAGLQQRTVTGVPTIQRELGVVDCASEAVAVEMKRVHDEVELLPLSEPLFTDVKPLRHRAERLLAAPLLSSSSPAAARLRGLLMNDAATLAWLDGDETAAVRHWQTLSTMTSSVSPSVSLSVSSLATADRQIVTQPRARLAAPVDSFFAVACGIARPHRSWEAHAIAADRDRARTAARSADRDAARLHELLLRSDHGEPLDAIDAIAPLSTSSPAAAVVLERLDCLAPRERHAAIRAALTPAKP